MTLTYQDFGERLLAQLRQHFHTDNIRFVRYARDGRMVVSVDDMERRFSEQECAELLGVRVVKWEDTKVTLQ